MAGIYDMVKMTVASTPGTGTITLGAAAIGFQTFDSAGVPNGKTVSYSIKDGNDWEVGRGVYTASGTTLTRGPMFSSNGGAEINASIDAIVGIVFLAEDFQLSLGGNTSGAVTMTMADLTLVGGDNITLSGGDGVVTISGAAGGGGGTGQNRFAVGNTTGDSSSAAGTLSIQSISFAGAISGGFDTNSSGLLIISAPAAAASGTAVSRSAVGNTTGSTTSDVGTLTQWTLSGSLGASVGLSGNTVVIAAPTTAASGTAMNRSVSGNTTGDSSSAVGTLTQFKISGAGGVSVGFDTNVSGLLVISGATTVASGTAQNRTAIGNTTGATSSDVATLSQLTISGSLGASVGMSDGTLVIAAPTPAASATSMGQTAVGNTIGLASSQTREITAETISGAGGVSVGFSNGTLLVSGNTAGAGAPMSYFEPRPLADTSTIAVLRGTMTLVPVNLQAVLTFNQVRMIASRVLASVTLSVVTQAGQSGTATASAGAGITHSLVLYTKADATTFTSVTSTTLGWGFTSSYSVSRTAGSNTVSLSIIAEYGSGSTTSRETLTTTTSSAAGTTYALGLGASSISHSGLVYFYAPWQSTMATGMNVVGVVHTAAFLTATGQTWLAATTAAWSLSFVHGVNFNAGPRLAPGNTNTNVGVPYGGGFTSSVGSVAPASVTFPASSGAASAYMIPYMELGVL